LLLHVLTPLLQGSLPTHSFEVLHWFCSKHVSEVLHVFVEVQVFPAEQLLAESHWSLPHQLVPAHVFVSHVSVAEH